MIELDHQNGVAVIKMTHRPANAIDATFLSLLTDTIAEQIDSDAKAIILTGEGNIFSAGVDLIQLLKGGTEYIRAFLDNLEQMLDTVFFCPKPVVAAINGHAIAGGCVLACCADMRLMAEGQGRIGVPELRVGVPFPVIIMELIRAKVNNAYFEEIMLGGATYLADAALQRGLVDDVLSVEDLMPKALATAESLACIRSEIYAFTKLQMRQSVREAIASGNKLFADEIRAIWESELTSQSISSYVENTLKK